MIRLTSVLFKLLFCFLFLLSLPSFSQVAIGTSGTATPNPKAVLLLTGANQGLIIPIVNSKGSVNATITEKGMVVFDDSDKKVYFFDGTAWNQVGGGSGGSQSISINGNLIQLSGSPASSFPLASALGPAANQNGQLLMWNQINSRWEATANTPTATNGMVLTWNGTTNTWEPKAPSAVLPSLSASQLLSNNGSNVGITAAGDLALSVTGTTGTFTIANNAVTNLKLAGSIAASKLIGTDINTVGTITSGVWNGTKVSEAFGGTNQITYATGDILYASASNTLGKLPIGTANQVLTVNAGLPVWSAGGTGWALGGNIGTIDGAVGTGTNYIGTKDNVPLNFLMNNQRAGRIDNVNASTFFGSVAGSLNTGGQNAGFGSQALEKNVGGGSNAAFGQLSLNNNTTGNYNVAVGAISMTSNTTGANNIGIGVQSNNNNTTGSGNTAIGYNANFGNISSGFNTIVGIDAAFNNTGANNTALGRQALFTNTTGSNNTAVGYKADVAATVTNATAVGANASATTSNTIQLGDALVTTVNIGTGTTAKLVAGGLQIIGGIPGLGKVLTSDATGLATWQSGSTGWGLTGNTGTTPSTQYIGTSDAQDLSIRTNTVEAMRIYQSGQVGIGATPVSAKLEVGSSTNTIGIHTSSTVAGAAQNRALQADAAGSSTQNFGVYSSANVAGSNGAIGVYGEAIGTGTSSATGVFAVAPSGFLNTSGTAYGLYAAALGSSTTNWAGYFSNGNVHITNGLSVGAVDGTFGTAGQVLTSAGAGLPPTWAAAGGGWGLTGNTLAGGEKLGSINGNPLPFITNSIERMRIDAAGNIGIGTSAPNAPLQFSNSVANRKIVFYEGVNNDHQFIGLGLSPSTLRFQTDNSASDHVFFAGTSSTTSNELMRIKGNGSVGIGTTAPVNKLDIEGGLAVGATYSGTSAAPTNGAIIEGNVGIGTTVPNAPLQFSNTLANRKIVFYEGVNNDHQFIGFGLSVATLRYQADNPSTDHIFYAGTSSTTSNELMRIKGTGNVGIGTATPTSALEVNGQVKITGGTPGLGKVLTSDAAGLATWTTVPVSISPANTLIKGNSTGVAQVASQIFDDGTSVTLTTIPTTNVAKLTVQNEVSGGPNGIVGGTKAIRAAVADNGSSQVTAIEAQVTGANIGQQTGVFSNVSGTSGFNRAVVALASNSASTNIGVDAYATTATTGSNYGLRSNIGNATNNYGLYVSAGGTGTKYGVYSSGEDINYFSGNVGIGTTAPTSKLDVQLSSTSNAISGQNTSTGYGGYFFSQGGYGIYATSNLTDAGFFHGSVTVDNGLYVTGLTGGTGTLGFASRSYFKQSASTAITNDATTTSVIAIRADGNILAFNGAFIATSDKRIKEIISTTDNKKDLNDLLQIEITDYRFIDKIANDNRVHKKVIAQQLQSIYANAVNVTAGIVPNVFEAAKKSTVVDGKTHVETKKPHQFTSGDEVKLILEKQGEKKYKINVINENEFVVDEPLYENVFVYGKKVKDLLTVDYDALTTLNISATQELARKVETLEKENAMLKQNQKRMDSLQTMAIEQNKRIGELEASKSELESLKLEIATIKRVLGIEAKATTKK